jgi:prolyl-tRNA synthetase
VRTVEEVAQFLGESPARFIKTLLYTSDSGETVAALVRGDRELSEAKLRAILGAQWVALADEATVQRITGAPVGFVGPIALKARTIADFSIAGITGAVTGANEEDFHVVGVDQVRDLGQIEFADVCRARQDDVCGRCSAGRIAIRRGIEVGQVFYLGTKYSQPMGAKFLDAAGVEQPIEMGTYGIGITRTMAAALEQNHDQAGIVWPLPIAPFEVLVLPVSVDDDRQRETAERLYAELSAAGVDVLLDDRRERAGVKFKDADLIGVPLRVTVGPRALERSCVEVKARTDAENTTVAVEDATTRLAAEVRQRRIQ